MGFLCILALFFAQLANLSLAADLPSEPGIYFQQENAQWLKLKATTLSGMKTKGLEQYIQTNGYIGFKTDFICDGAHASFRITSPKPVFYIHDIGAATDAMIIQFTLKKDIRSIHASSSDAAVDNKGGFRKESIRKAIIATHSDKSFSIAPEEDLKSGEYLLILGNTTTGYDFGIDGR